MNRKFAIAVASLFVLVASPAISGPQQEKMKACNVEAKGMKGDERKAFMKECLSAKKSEAQSARATQQEKMKSCNADAKSKGLAGDERKKFMSDCLKGS